MKIINGLNIMLFVLIIDLFLILSCKPSSKNSLPGVLLETDKQFSELSVKEGMFRAFISYIADDGVILRDNEYPSKGKEVLIERYQGKSDTSFVLSWEPLSGRISDSGDLGYTYGIFSTLIKATGKVSRGTYVTIWHKQTDGTWKFVLDTGTEGLPDLNPVSPGSVSGQ
jgi:ketosteroid isomerase-like protein